MVRVKHNYQNETTKVRLKGKGKREPTEQNSVPGPSLSYPTNSLRVTSLSAVHLSRD